MQPGVMILDADLEPARQDEQAVAAVRSGDAGRYRELVERHERRVYAVAWSRLGDAGLAEEATQEAFVRAYRHLGLLGDGAKFSAWIGTIGRNAAISLGLRQRRELEKRARWALEQPVATEPVADTAEEAGTAETLRQALADLPAAHRECLVLFYLEGKSGAEAASALGISEAALRVRLHRARTALRERMEERLGESLEQLRPRHTMVPSVMAAVMSGSTAKIGAGGGFGATLAAAVGKVLPVKVAAMMFSVAWVLPSVGLSWWMGEMERKNFRDKEGFRVRLHRRNRWRKLGFILAIMLLAFGSARLFPGMLGFKSGMIVYSLVFGALAVAVTGIMTRQLVINRSTYQVTLCIGMGLMAVALLAPAGLMAVPFILAMALMIFAGNKHGPMRMDYNLFLRATQGMLENSTASAVARENGAPMAKAELLAFARFLGEHWLAVNFRWSEEGLALRLPRVDQVDLMSEFRAYFWSKYSWIRLNRDGTVQAHRGSKDEKILRELIGPSDVSCAAAEAQVAGAVEEAWRAFRAGDAGAAERMLGQEPEAKVFVAPPAQAQAALWRYGIFAVFVVAVIFMVAHPRPEKAVETQPLPLQHVAPIWTPTK